MVSNVIFRTNASSELGMGHLMRCRALAHQLKDLGVDCYMVGPPIKYQVSLDEKIFSNWHVTKNNYNEKYDAEEFISVGKFYNCTRAVIDDYRAGEKYQQILFASGIKWLQFDMSRENPMWAQWILNASPEVKEADYKTLLKHQNQELLLGPSYAILRKEFHQNLPKYIFDLNNIRILVTFGGGNDCGAIIFSLQALYKKHSNVTFVIISGENNKSNKEIISWIESHGNNRIELHINPEKIQPIIITCDFAIMAGGTSTFEVAISGLPMIIMTISKNQINQAFGWGKLGIANYLGCFGTISIDQMQEAVSKILKRSILLKMRERALNIVENNGARKTAELLIR